MPTTSQSTPPPSHPSSPPPSATSSAASATVRRTLLSSVVAFVGAALLELTLHELAHAVAAVALGGSPVVYGNSVDPGQQTPGASVLTAAAGPVFSLLSGLALLALPTRRLPSSWRLWVLWLGLLSVQTFAGYLITGPFMAAGDVGQVLAATPAPVVLGWLGFVVGWVVTALLGRHAVARFVPFLSDAAPLAPQLRAVGLHAWLVGAALTIAVSVNLLAAGGVPADIVAFEAFGMATGGIFLFFVRPFLPLARRARYGDPAFGTPVAGIVVAVVVIVLRQVLFADGLAL